MEAVLDDIAVQIKNSAVQVFRTNAFCCCWDDCRHFLEVLAEALIDFSVAGVDDFFIEVVSVDEDGLTFVDGSGHEDDAVF